MNVLAFDTATRATTVALWDPDGTRPPREARDDPVPGERPGHARRLLPLISTLLESDQIGWEEVDRLAVGVGPGTFTGLRIGIATARALSRARGIPLVGISTLESLALGAQLATDLPAELDTVLAVIDARRREVFAASWPLDGGVSEAERPPSFGPRALAPAMLASNVGKLGGGVIALGDGAVEFRGVLEQSGVWIPEAGSGLHRVSAANHCRLAAGRRPGSADEVRPVYLRLPDAELARTHRGDR
jgi:tRNA threonylcarbamoyladenosine biosynthesis protein TsaB